MVAFGLEGLLVICPGVGLEDEQLHLFHMPSLTCILSGERVCGDESVSKGSDVCGCGCACWS